MQKIQMGGGYISPAVVEHVRKNVVQALTLNVQTKQLSSMQFGGGVINPAIKKHVSHSAKATMGGGIISSEVLKHVKKSLARVRIPEMKVSSSQAGGGAINPAVRKHLASLVKVSMGGGFIHPNIAKHVLTQ